MTHFSHSAIILFLLLTNVLSEWIEITQKPQNPEISNTSVTKILRKPALHDLAESDDDSWAKPSPQWIEYQRERFSHKRLKNSSSQKLVVSGTTNLKNSAKIIVPAMHGLDPNISVAKKNRFFRAKARLEVVNDKPDIQLVELPQRFEQQTTPRRNSEEDDEANVDDEEDLGDYSDNNNGETSQLQFPTLQGFVKFLKGLQKTWLKKSSFDDKIKLLKQLRDNLMRKIEEQFAVLWPSDDTESQQRRNRRSILDESNLNFPPEAALMSINFLTFAVFLIKLVLQVIHIVKSKHYSFSGLQMNTDPVIKASVLRS